MRIMIIGAGGFIGSYITPKLAEKHTIIPIYKDAIDLFDAQNVGTLLEHIKPDIVINCLSFGGKTELHNKDNQNVGKNMMLFYSFYVNRHLFKTFFNLASGIELDKTQDNAYAFSKRLITNTIRFDHSFVTLRIFGCFGSGEPAHRLLKKYNASTGVFEIENDRLFDYFSIQDFYNVLKYYVDRVDVGITSFVNNVIDCVYENKMTISQFLDLYCEINNLEKRHVVKTTSKKDYIGDSTILVSLREDIRLYGIAHGLKVYNE